ncbi:hypothetical protein BSYN_14240 [Bacteroides sedimenti]|uniref:HU domain-containing protein n=2 Tax=Bacteroides sedimenti TaxID=2136147 RepID=A0ABM8IAX4_9BACE
MYTARTPGWKAVVHPGVEGGYTRVKREFIHYKFIKIKVMTDYVVRTKMDKSGDEEKVRYYGVPVTSGQVGVKELARDICSRCSLNAADVHAAVVALGDVMRNYLLKGNTVYLEDIGLFSISASSEGFDTPDECTPSKMKAQRVCFKADKGMRSILRKVKFQRSNRAVTKINKQIKKYEDNTIP